MKLTLRLVLVPVSLAVAFLVAIWGERFTVARWATAALKEPRPQ